MNSSVFLAIASAALFVLVFQGGEAADVDLQDILRPNLKTDGVPPVVNMNGTYNYQAAQQVFFISGAPETVTRGMKNCVTYLERDDHTVRPDIEVHKIDKPMVNWNMARKSCMEEGASSDMKWLEYNTTRLNGSKISCVPTLSRDDYNIVSGVGAYKVHTRNATWFDARETCVAEGGQLAVMDSSQKQEIFQKWRGELYNAAGLWLGFHDLFEEGKWVTVTGESIDSIDYSPWPVHEPNDAGGQDCAILWMNGMDDLQCSRKESFICEINLCETLGHQIYHATSDSERESYVFYG